MEQEYYKIYSSKNVPSSPFGDYCLQDLPIISDTSIIPMMSKLTKKKLFYLVATALKHSDEQTNKKEIILSGCNCVKTKCLKLYCECFANSSKCTKACKCRSCNNNENDEIRVKAITEALERNPAAFQHSRYTCTRGCNCRWSGCRKKYCECFLNGVSCSAVCRCQMCKNIKSG
ncbi:hypothetical protein SteCoe_34317 [Stentor coeruleus]|uniref:CRC domain-containing protein n=1 Tax=Stentor coeruleus TaxID=5963 RepID=A0A1R2AV64_9CILI|nr:hypothetical protein SteCoe_34317 [Stentor coeruleus]